MRRSLLALADRLRTNGLTKLAEEIEDVVEYGSQAEVEAAHAVLSEF